MNWCIGIMYAILYKLDDDIMLLFLIISKWSIHNNITKKNRQPKEIKTKKKFSKEQEEIIRDLRNNMKQCSLPDFVKHLEVSNNINIGIATLRKILNHKY